MSKVVDLNVGGVVYATSLTTLRSMKDGTLASLFKTDDVDLPRDREGRYFIDRDGVLFRYILDYIRNKKLLLPDHFKEKERLKYEAEYYRLPELIKLLNIKCGHNLPPIQSGGVQSGGLQSGGLQHLTLQPSISRSITNSNLSDRTGVITIGYRGTFAFGREGLVDVKFRKLNRILVCGKVTLCRSVFGDTLNESRDPDRGDSERYSARFFLKHHFIEQAFDMLLDAGFILRGGCGTGTNSMPTEGLQGAPKVPSQYTAEGEEGRWYHYNEFIWVKEDRQTSRSP